MGVGSVDIVGIIGNSVSESLSPTMHNAAFKHAALNWTYLPFQVDPSQLASAIDSIRNLNMTGVNVTMPYKADVISLLDKIDEEAMLINSVNTIHNVNGELVGYSTDGQGLIDSLKDNAVKVRNKKILILGSGGAARAVTNALVSDGAKAITVISRKPEKSEGFIKQLEKRYPECKIDIGYFTAQGAVFLKEAEIIINATPLGKLTIDGLSFLVDGLETGQLVYDLNTVPLKSALLVAAQERGCRVIGGLGMLVYQGALSYKIWTGKDAPIDVMKKAISNKDEGGIQ